MINIEKTQFSIECHQVKFISSSVQIFREQLPGSVNLQKQGFIHLIFSNILMQQFSFFFVHSLQ